MRAPPLVLMVLLPPEAAEVEPLRLAAELLRVEEELLRVAAEPLRVDEELLPRLTVALLRLELEEELLRLTVPPTAREVDDEEELLPRFTVALLRLELEEELLRLTVELLRLTVELLLLVDGELLRLTSCCEEDRLLPPPLDWALTDDIDIAAAAAAASAILKSVFIMLNFYCP